MTLTYERLSPKLISVKQDGVFLCHCNRSRRDATLGMFRERVGYWYATVNGAHYSAPGITQLKSILREAMEGRRPGRGR